MSNEQRSLRSMTEELMKQLYDQKIKDAVPKSQSAERFMSIVQTCIQTNPVLLTVNRASLVHAIFACARDGLIPDGREALIQAKSVKTKRNGQDEFVPMAVFMPMVRGIIKSIYNTGVVTMLDAAVAYEKDSFVFERGDSPKIVHVPHGGDDDPGKVTAAYVVFTLAGGEKKREVIWRRDIEKIRAMSSAPNAAWVKWYDQFAIKAVIKRASKQLQLSAENMEVLDRLFENDNSAMGFSGIEALDGHDQPDGNAHGGEQPPAAARPGESSRLGALKGQNSGA